MVLGIIIKHEYRTIKTICLIKDSDNEKANSLDENGEIVSKVNTL